MFSEPPTHLTFFVLALGLPLTALACGHAFQSGSGDVSGDEAGIVLGEGGSADGGNEATADAGSDVRHDGPSDSGAEHDGGKPDGEGMPETGGGCPAGWLSCSDGGCAQPGPTNCGTCGNDCTSLPHVQGPTCSNGQCSFTCQTGWGHCTSNPNDGCETDTTTAQNCDTCGATCSNATPVCAGGTGCVSGCPAGKPTLCDGGTCADTTSDPQNCNGCGNVCPLGPANSTPTCASSTCGWTCDANYEQCGNTCLLAVPDAVHGVFVAPGGGTTSCGDIAAPCGTVSAALTALEQSGGTKTTVYVAESTTPYVDIITTFGGIGIEGGWVYEGAGQWSHPCALDPSATVIDAPASMGAMVAASYVVGNFGGPGVASVSNLTLSNTSAATNGTADVPGESLYGAVANGTLALDNVVVLVGTGGTGGTGKPGLDGGAPAANCNPGDGKSGAAGTPGAAAPAETYTGGEDTPQTGGMGTNGTDGDNGVRAPQPSEPNGPECAQVYVGTNTSNPSCGNVGAGPGDGCETLTDYTVPFCGGVGQPGCGSGGSTGGFGGTGGGASIGVLAYSNAVIHLNNVTIVTQGGGHGGDGGLGGNVTPGSSGIAGTSAQYVTNCTNKCNSQTGTCTCSPSTYRTVAGGIAGYAGGTGGKGGQGGGGSGGDSFCYATSGTNSSVTATGVTCTHGPGGAGGNPGLSNQGTAGRSAVHN